MSSIEATAVDPTEQQQHETIVLGNEDFSEDDLLKFDELVVNEQEKEKITTSDAGNAGQLIVQLQVPQLSSNYSSNSLVDVPLHESSDEELNDIEDGGMGRDLEDDEVDEEGEHADHLSPLMMDNHTIVEHLECYQSNSPTNELSAPVMVVDSAGNITIMKHSDTKDSLSSLDSDLGLSFDSIRSPRHQPVTSTDESQGSGSSSSDNDPSRDSGCETGPFLPNRPYCPVSEVDEDAAAHHHEDEDMNDEDRPFEMPNEEFSERIVEQVEYYFSNESILKDAFLLKHVRRNKEGFVSLKLVSSFKRVRQLTKDWRVVGHAIQLKSKTIELNDVGTKVRRIDALPNYDETMPSRTVVATDLHAEKITIEKAYEMFSSCGEIALVRILRVGGPIPADVRQFINKYPELLQKECALVEFVESRSARNALAYEGITVLEMVAPKKKTGKKAIVTRMVERETQPTSSLMMFGASGPAMDQERSRGGAPLDNSAPPRFQMRRAASGYYSKPDQVMYVPPPRKFGYSHGSGTNFSLTSAPNVSAAPPSPVQQGYINHHHHHHQQQPHHGSIPNNPNHQYQSHQPTMVHHHQSYHHNSPPPRFHAPHSPSDTYEVYRRTSEGHIVAVNFGAADKFNPDRRFPNCSAEPFVMPEIRRGSHPLPEMGGPRKMHAQQPVSIASPQPVYECQCNCQASAGPTHRRMPSSCNDLSFRRMSTSSQGFESRKLSNATSGGGALERKVSVTETNWRNETPAAAPPVTVERKYSNDHHTTTTVQYHHPPESPIRKFSTGFDPLRKLSSGTDEYVNGRRISTDSGYDRKYSFSSDCSNARSRSNSFICNHAPEQIIRAPTGPAGDGSRGFGTRTRKIGHILPPI